MEASSSGMILRYADYYDTGKIPTKWIDGKDRIALSDAHLLADALNMWACIIIGVPVPEKFTEVIMSIAKHLGMEQPPTGDGFLEYGYSSGLLSKQS